MTPDQTHHPARTPRTERQLLKSACQHSATRHGPSDAHLCPLDLRCPGGTDTWRRLAPAADADDRYTRLDSLFCHAAANKAIACTYKDTAQLGKRIFNTCCTPLRQHAQLIQSTAAQRDAKQITAKDDELGRSCVTAALCCACCLSLNITLCGISTPTCRAIASCAVHAHARRHS